MPGDITCHHHVNTHCTQYIGENKIFVQENVYMPHGENPTGALGSAIPPNVQIPVVYPTLLNFLASSNSATAFSAGTSGFTWWSGPQM